MRPGPLKIALGLGFAGALLCAFGGKKDELMPLEKVPAILTTLDEGQAALTLRDAFFGLERRYPTVDELAMALAQSSLETAKWTKMFCGNWGNSVTSHGPYFQLGNDTKHHYQAFASVEDGAKHWLSILRDSFPLAWALLGSTDTRAYATALKSGVYGEYYEAPLSSYVLALNSWYSHMMTVAQAVSNPPEV